MLENELFATPPKLTKLPAFSLRDYQEAAVDALLVQLRRGVRSCHLVVPTGGGKSVVLAEYAAHRLDSGRILGLVPRIELAGQLAEQFRRRLGDVVGVVQGGRVELAADVVVAVVDGMRADRVAALLSFGAVGTLLIDECHHAVPGSRYETVLKQLRRENSKLAVVGCTATPIRFDDKRLASVVGPCVFSRSIAALQDDGYLAPFSYARVVVPELDLTGGGGAAEYDEIELGAAVERAVLATVSRTSGHLRGRKTLAFGVTVAHAQHLASEFERVGFRAQAVWGAMPIAERRENIKRFAAGELDILANCGVLTEGYDCPSVTALLMARPTRAVGLYVQMLGRGARTFAGKTDCLVVDVAGLADPTAVPQLMLESATLREYRQMTPGVPAGEADPKTRNLVGGFGSDHIWILVPTVAGRKVDALACILSPAETLLAVPADRKSGLYVGLSATNFGRDIEMLSEAAPIEAVGELLRERLETSGKGALNRSGLDWRNEPPTEKQLALLHRAYRGRPPEVETRGDAANAILLAHARKAIARYLGAQSHR